MAEDMIERVARRLWDHSFDRMPDPPWEQTTELQKQFNRMLAREAIAEMREPTKEMIEVYMDLEPMDDDSGYNPPAAIPAWQAMIDAALNPKQPGAT